MNTKNMKLEEVARLVDGQITGDKDLIVTGFAPLASAGVGDLSFLVKAANVQTLKESQASAFLVPTNLEELPGKTLIRVKDPNLAGAIIHNAFLAVPFVAAGVHERAFVGENCELHPEITIAPLAVLGDRVRVGRRVRIESGVVIGNDVEIGEDTVIKANAVLSSGSQVGRRVIIHSGVIIGADGYGYATDTNGNHVKRPQVGIVRIDDDVEIGANSCVDRATYGVTWIKSGVKIDNLVQVGHNVVIGENSLLVAQAGIAGSTTLGRSVVMGGQSAIKGHIHLEDRVMVAACSGVHGNQPQGSMVGGVPAIPIRTWTKAVSIFAKLPEIYSEIRKMKKDVAQLQARDELKEAAGREVA
ncbi:MAG: UDP-3-O-(3-hydroxymyristoyl)glucosamine N-acyltransferase [Desulfoprunum sp.]|nr:UDP-3-O-(3-hydroxymyristoyl)glucosamine N-acyltransferase [Desulfoprunum sp.]